MASPKYQPSHTRFWHLSSDNGNIYPLMCSNTHHFALNSHIYSIYSQLWLHFSGFHQYSPHFSREWSFDDKIVSAYLSWVKNDVSRYVSIIYTKFTYKLNISLSYHLHTLIYYKWVLSYFEFPLSELINTPFSLIDN